MRLTIASQPARKPFAASQRAIQQQEQGFLRRFAHARFACPG
jgi:hypothetical protein